MKLYPNAHNILAVAVVAALNPVASEALRTTAYTRTGGGLVNPTGGYTGQTDCTFDVEILNDTIVGTPRVSTPTFNGVGNAVMSGVSAAGGVAAQSITITLADLGTETRSAYAPFQGVTLRAKAALFANREDDANYIEITVTDNTTRTATNKSLLADLIAGTNEYTGAEWDFGGRPLNPDGTIPENTARISIGDDPQVYRQFKVFQTAGYVYSFSPAPVRTIPKTSVVKTVTNGYTVTVTHTLGAAADTFAVSTAYVVGDLVLPITPNGHWYECTASGTSAGTSPTWPTNGTSVTTGTATFIDRGVHTNTYSSIETLFDALTAIQGDADSLIEVDAAIVNDLSFNGMGINDLSVRTGAFVASIVKDGSFSIRNANISITCDPDSPTEELLIRCSDASTFNAELWEPQGTISSVFPVLVTGVSYTYNGYTILIPENTPPDVAPSAEISAKLTSSATTTKPILCISQAVAGARARPRTFTFEWQIRTEDCTCDDASVVGGPNPDCLGIDPGVTDVTALPAALKPKAEDLYNWFSDFVTANSEILAGNSGEIIDWADSSGGNTTAIQQAYGAVLKVDRIDIQAATRAKDILWTALRRVYDENNNTLPAAAETLWDAALVTLDTDLSVIEGNFGANFWTDYGLALNDSGTGADATLRIPLAKKIFTQDFDAALDKYRALMNQVLIAADIEPPFGSSSSQGSDCWTDHNEDGWWVAQDSQLLPIQPGYGYHSVIRQDNGDGTFTIVPTQEFFFGHDIGCPQNLTAGDRLEIRIGETGTTLPGYQQGDNARIQIIAGSAVQLGGGQDGDDTQVWSVVGSVDGALPNYLLNKTAVENYTDGTATFIVSHLYAVGDLVTPISPNGRWYIVTVAGTSAGTSPTWPTNGGTVTSGGATFRDLGPYVDFTITPGGIASQLGDAFVFWIEGGQFQWRKNAGSWSAATQIAATVSLSDGVSASFDTGTAPSFVDGDTYTFAAKAVNGGSHASSLTYGGIVTTEFTETVDRHRLEAVLTTAESASECAIQFQLPTEVGATVTVRGFADSADIEGTEVVTGSAVTNGSRSLLITLDETDIECEKWTVTYYSTGDTPETIGWQFVFVGHPLTMTLVNGLTELGEVSQQWRQPVRSGYRSDIGATVQCSGCSTQSVEDLRYALDYAALNDDNRMGLLIRPSVPAASRAKDAYGNACTAFPEFGIVAIDSDTLRVTDDLAPGFQSTDTTKSLLALTLELVPV